MIVNETLPVISDGVLGGGVQSVVVSTVLIVMYVYIGTTRRLRSFFLHSYLTSTLVLQKLFRNQFARVMVCTLVQKWLELSRFSSSVW